VVNCQAQQKGKEGGGRKGGRIRVWSESSVEGFSVPLDLKPLWRG